MRGILGFTVAMALIGAQSADAEVVGDNAWSLISDGSRYAAWSETPGEFVIADDRSEGIVRATVDPTCTGSAASRGVALLSCNTPAYPDYQAWLLDLATLTSRPLGESNTYLGVYDLGRYWVLGGITEKAPGYLVYINRVTGEMVAPDGRRRNLDSETLGPRGSEGERYVEYGPRRKKRPQRLLFFRGSRSRAVSQCRVYCWYPQLGAGLVTYSQGKNVRVYSTARRSTRTLDMRKAMKRNEAILSLRHTERYLFVGVGDPGPIAPRARIIRRAMPEFDESRALRR